MAKPPKPNPAGNSFPTAGEAGHVFWLFGLSGAGKSTLAEALCAGIHAETQTRPLMVDGDRLRRGVSKGLGFSDEDRHENIRRAAEVARLGLESGQIVIAAFITPKEKDRRLVAEIIGRENLSLVHVAASLEVCRQRDVKGLYANAVAGKTRQMTGMDSQFELPTSPALRIETHQEMVHQSAAKLIAYARPHFLKAIPPCIHGEQEKTG